MLTYANEVNFKYSRKLRTFIPLFLSYLTKYLYSMPLIRNINNIFTYIKVLLTHKLNFSELPGFYKFFFVRISQIPIIFIKNFSILGLFKIPGFL